MDHRSPARLHISLFVLIVLVMAGLAGLSVLKFSSFLSDSVHERVQIVAATSARDFEAVIDLGLSVPEVASADDILERARAHDPLITSIAVFGLDGSVIHGVGDAGSRIDSGSADAFRLAAEGITDTTWRADSAGLVTSGTIITGAFEQPLAGVLVRYSTVEMGHQRSDMLSSLARDALAGTAVAALLLATMALVGTRSRRATARPSIGVPSVALALIVGAVVFGALTLRNFNDALEPELERRASLIGETLRDDTERALGYGIPISALRGLDEYFQLFLDEFPELDYLALTNGDRTLALASAADRPDAPDLALPSPIDFGEELGSVVHVFPLDPDDVAGGAAVLGVDPDYVRSRLTDLALDVGVILVVAVVIAMEITIALDSRLASSPTVRRERRRNPVDARLILLTFAVAEELNKSFLPIFVRAADNPTGLAPNLAISLPIITYLLVVAIASPWAGQLVLRFGERRLLLVGLTAAAGSHLGMVAATDVVQIAALRGLTGFGYAAATIASMEYLLERLSPGNRARGVGVFVTVVMGGTFAGTALGGIFADRLGYDAVFLISFGLVALTGVLAMRLLEPGMSRPDTSAASLRLRDIVTVIRRPRLAALIAGVTIPMNVLAAAFLWYLVPLSLDELGSSASTIARTLMVYYLMVLLGTPVAGRLSTRFTPSTTVGLAGAISGGVLLVLWASTSTFTVLVAVLVVGIAHAAIRGPQLALGMELAQEEVAGVGRDAVLAAMRSLERVGSLIGLVVIAVLASEFGLTAATTAVGIAVGSSAIVFLMTTRTAVRVGSHA